MRLTRLESTDEGTFGVLEGEGLRLHSGELPWRNNAPRVSCIPAGDYRVVWAWSPRFRRMTYRVLDVPGRSGVLIHPANLFGDGAQGYKVQLSGCISLGERRGTLGGQKALLVSAPAVRRLEEALARREFVLEIRGEPLFTTPIE